METVGLIDLFPAPLPPETSHRQIERGVCTHDDRCEGWQFVLRAKPDQQRLGVVPLTPGRLRKRVNGRSDS